MPRPLPTRSAASLSAGGAAAAGRALHTSPPAVDAPLPGGATNPKPQQQSLLLSDISVAGHRAPLLLGFYNYFERHVPSVGFFEPIGARSLSLSELGVDRHVEL